MGNKNSRSRRRGSLLLDEIFPGAASSGPTPGGAPGNVSAASNRRVHFTVESAKSEEGRRDQGDATRVISIDRAKMTVLTDANPFECSICMNLYNDQENLPTTFLCGHSVCLVHIHQLKRCPFCRGPIPLPQDCHPTIALRDAAMLFAQITAEVMGRAQADDNDEDGDDDNEASKLVRDGSWQLVESQISRHQQVVDSSEQLRQLQERERLQADDERSRQVAADEAMARALQQEEQLAHRMEQERRQQEAARVALEIQRREVLAAAQMRQRQAAAAAAPSSPGQGSPQMPMQRPTGTRSCPTCQKVCFLPERLGKCCACLDRRPVQPDGTYPQYVDGVGWVNTGRRTAGYCPLCSTV